MSVKRVEFQWDEQDVVARVHLGKTSARGDDPDDVISINVSGRPYITLGEYRRLSELALERARSEQDQ